MRESGAPLQDCIMSAVVSQFSLPVDMPTIHVVLQCIGVLGSLTYVCVFFLVQSGRLCGNSVVYPCCLLIAATCVAASLSTAFNLAAFLIQVSFISISIFGIWYRISGRMSARLQRSSAMEMPDRHSVGS